MSTSLRIGLVCSSRVGGSGILATELGRAMARRGHQVHFITDERPHRLEPHEPNVTLHAARPAHHPSLQNGNAPITLASALVRVSLEHDLHILHAHYAVPYVAAAWIAKQILGPGGPKVMSTVHGTDVTHVGPDPDYLPVVRHALLHSDAVTAPSRYLRDRAWAELDLDPEQTPIDVVPNFVDLERFRPAAADANEHLTALFGPEAETVPVLVHVSNFRPVKRGPAVVDIFARICAERPAFLLLVGDGPDRPEVERELRRRGLIGRARILGTQDHFQTLLRACTVFLLPSSHESFGLAALEALSSGVPVVASAVGGVPEVVQDGKTGFLVEPHDIEAMASAARRICDSPGLHARMRTAARIDVEERFGQGPLVQRFEDLYRALRD